MAKTDFFDDDLLNKNEPSERVPVISEEQIRKSSEDVDGLSELPVKTISDFNLTRMAKRKEEVNAQVAYAMKELEILRTRQEDLELEKRELEELRQKQQAFEKGKKEIAHNLHHSLLRIEKNELDARKFVECLSSTRERFRSLLLQIEELNEEKWRDEDVHSELNRSLALLEEARGDYNKSIAQLDVLSTSLSPTPLPETEEKALLEPRPWAEPQKRFRDWLKMGWAVSLPLILTLVGIALVSFFIELGLL